MDRAGAKPNAALGFLTVVEDPQHGLFGGYLVLNSAGRPLEFHCTAPVKPNRAQEILYGPTLEPFLYGEQIGQTLLSKAKTSPLLVCTDRPAAMAVRDHVQVPVALVLPVVGGEGIGNREEGSGFSVQRTGDESAIPPAATGGLVSIPLNSQPSTLNPQPSYWRIDPAHGGTPLVGFQLGRNRIAVAETNRDDCRLLAERMGSLAESFDLIEPFGRIREAIEEARRGRQAD